MREFRLADGGVRYYATAHWTAGPRPTPSDFYLGAWLDDTPTLRILAVEANQYELPDILSVSDLGNGKTGMIISSQGEDSIAILLVEYSDGLDVGHMLRLESLTAGE